MKFSELKVNPNHQFVQMAKQALPDLDEALLADYEEVHKQIIEMMGADEELSPEMINQYRVANHNYFLYFFYGAYSILDPNSKLNKRWRDLQQKQLGKMMESMTNKQHEEGDK